MRTIRIIDDITNESYLSFTKKLAFCENSDDKDVTIELCSDGGISYTALAFHDRIKASSCNITIIATGLVASAAALILAAGKTRLMTPNAWVMVHDDCVIDTDGKRVAQAEKELAHYRRLETQWNTLMAASTGSSIELWDRLHREETYLNRAECQAFGLLLEVTGE